MARCRRRSGPASASRLAAGRAMAKRDACPRRPYRHQAVLRRASGPAWPILRGRGRERWRQRWNFGVLAARKEVTKFLREECGETYPRPGWQIICPAGPTPQGLTVTVFPKPAAEDKTDIKNDNTVQPWFVCWRETFDRGPGPRFKNLQLNSQTTTLKERKKRFEKEGDGLTFPNSFFRMKIRRLVVKLWILTGAPVIRLPANERTFQGWSVYGLPTKVSQSTSALPCI